MVTVELSQDEIDIILDALMLRVMDYKAKRQKVSAPKKKILDKNYKPIVKLYEFFKKA